MIDPNGTKSKTGLYSFDRFYDEKYQITFGTLKCDDIKDDIKSDDFSKQNTSSTQSNIQNRNNSPKTTGDNNKNQPETNNTNFDSIFEEFRIKNETTSEINDKIENDDHSKTNIESTSQTIVEKIILSAQSSFNSITNPILENVQQELSELKVELKHISEMMQNRSITIANPKTLEDKTNTNSNKIVNITHKSDNDLNNITNEKLLNNDKIENMQSTSKHINDIGHNNENIESSLQLIEEDTSQKKSYAINDISLQENNTIQHFSNINENSQNISELLLNSGDENGNNITQQAFSTRL